MLKEPAPVVLVSALGDNAVNLTTRAWSANGDFWPTYHRNYQLIKQELDKNNIGIPYPQREIHVISDGPAAALGAE